MPDFNRETIRREPMAGPQMAHRTQLSPIVALFLCAAIPGSLVWALTAILERAA